MRRYRTREEPRTPVTERECIHYWVIESAGGPTSSGVCRFCGAQREFHNSWPGFSYTERKPDFSGLSEMESEPDDEAEDSELERSGASLSV